MFLNFVNNSTIPLTFQYHALQCSSAKNIILCIPFLIWLEQMGWKKIYDKNYTSVVLRVGVKKCTQSLPCFTLWTSNLQNFEILLLPKNETSVTPRIRTDLTPKTIANGLWFVSGMRVHPSKTASRVQKMFSFLRNTPVHLVAMYFLL